MIAVAGGNGFIGSAMNLRRRAEQCEVDLMAGEKSWTVIIEEALKDAVKDALLDALGEPSEAMRHAGIHGVRVAEIWSAMAAVRLKEMEIEIPL